MHRLESLKKAWHFIWNDDSILSWIANIALAFILIKYIVYPGLGLLLGTNYPIVAVVSGSMHHTTSFDAWWTLECAPGKTPANIYKSHDVTQETFTTFPFHNGFNKGDIMILYQPKNLNIGDVLVFFADSRSDPIIHRIITTNKPNTHTTLGDNNCGNTASFEKNIPSDRYVGKAIFRLPILGWIKIAFVEYIAQPLFATVPTIKGIFS